jgi:hypothetical protein
MVFDGGLLILCVIGTITVFNTIRDVLRSRREHYFDKYVKRIFRPEEEHGGGTYELLFDALSRAAMNGPFITCKFLDAETGKIMTLNTVCFEAAQTRLGLWLRFDETTRSIWFMCRNSADFANHMTYTNFERLTAIKIF